MTAPDPRLTDARVKSTRKPKWDQHPAEWDVSNLDRMDGVGVDETLFPPARPVRVDSLRDLGPVIPQEPHTMYEPMRVLATLGFGFVCFVLGGAAVWAVRLAAVVTQ